VLESIIHRMLPELQSLIELQKADAEILRLREEIASLPRKVAAIEAKLAGTKAVLEAAKNSVKADDASRRKYETTIQDFQQKISKYRDQMLDVKTNEQYRALQHEIDFSNQEIRSTEDKILDLMVNAEAREKQVKSAEADLKAETAEIEREKKETRERTAEDEKQLAEWNAKRDKFREAVPADLLRHYERVAKFRKTGISEVRDQKCLACQVMLRPQTYNDVRSGTQVVICESCQRLLYFDPATEIAIERPSGPVRKRHHPKPDATHSWVYRSDYGEHGEVLLVFVNGGGGSTRRIYDFNNGRQIGDTLFREGNYHLAFPEDLAGGQGILLNGNWSEEEMDEWGNEMPMTVLDALHGDLQAARRELAAKSHPEAAVPVTNHSSAAS
jgi:uncharacterized protein